MLTTTLPDLNGLDQEALKALVLATHEQLLSRESEIEHLKLLIAKIQRVRLWSRACTRPSRFSRPRQGPAMVQERRGLLIRRVCCCGVLALASVVLFLNQSAGCCDPHSDFLKESNAFGNSSACAIRQIMCLRASQFCDGGSHNIKHLRR